MIDPNVPLAPSPYDKDYEITDAMFGAFRTPGGMPFFWKLFGWSTLLLTVLGALIIPSYLSAYVDFIKMSLEIETNPSASPSELFTAMGRFFLSLGIFTILYLAVMSVIRSAFFRCYFFGDDGGNFPFRFGLDELRQALAILGFLALFMLSILGGVIVLAIPIAIVGIASGGDAIILVILMMIALYIGLIVLCAWFCVRFCTAGALTALRGKTHVLAARNVSRGRFWALFGSLLVAGLIGYVVSSIASTTGLLMAFSGLTGGDIFTVLAGSDSEAILDAFERASETASFRISSFVAIALVSAGQAFYYLLLAGPQAFFTKQWAEAHSEY